MAAPQVPPRPSRATGPTDIPRVPPRPNRMPARSRSTSRDNFPRSPLNDIPIMNTGSGGSIYSNEGQNISESNLPQRPPSVSLPSVGQEGNEYADIYKPQDDSPNEPTQTRNVGSDLPLHAPRPSFSSSTAKARVSTVTRTDSTQAAAAGFGKARTPVSGDEKNHPTLRSKVSFSRTESSASTERPGSVQPDDHGIPEIGQRVPMYPDAGDVQAPSPSPFAQTPTTGPSLNEMKARHHGRTRSGREIFRPPGSYGLHGHGVSHSDQFEKAWYDKHPDALVREENGQYGPGISGNRGEWALSSEDLNKIVRDTASRGSGFGTPNHGGLPNEQIGYMASEEYTSRINTPGLYYGKAHSNHSQTHVESPLRKASFPVDVEGKDEFERSTSHPSQSQSEYALESEAEDDEIHVNSPENRWSKYTGSGDSTVDLGPRGGNTDAEGGWVEETGYGVPILASDEVAKEPGSEFLQPAVSPMQERRGSNYYTGGDEASYQGLRVSSRSGSATNSRPSSRPVSIHGTLPNLSRFTSHDEREDMHTPLEDVDEYEPLFPEEGDKEDRTNTAGRFKRRENTKRRFPSQDIWEDTPNSLQLQATVETPEPTEEQVAPAPKALTFEPPETESARKGEVGEEERVKLIPKDERLAKAHFKPLEELQRSGMKQRFPSRDIWEDSPDSARLEATVGEDEIKSSEGPGAVVTAGQDKAGDVDGTVDKPSIPPRPNKPKIPEPSSPSTFPSIPARPKRLNQDLPAKTESESLETRKAPTIPDRPKPQLPARPLRSAHDTSEINPAEGERRGIPAPKPKPALPARPINKIASLKAGFLSDLDKRLQHGPQGPKPQEKEPEVENAPLTDARKGRARGPARRKPATASAIAPSIAEGIEPEGTTVKPNWSIKTPWAVWETKDDGSFHVHATNIIPFMRTQDSSEIDPEVKSPGLKQDTRLVNPLDFSTQDARSKEPVSQGSSIKFTPSSSPSPTAPPMNNSSQTGEDIMLSPGSMGEDIKVTGGNNGNQTVE